MKTIRNIKRKTIGPKVSILSLLFCLLTPEFWLIDLEGNHEM